MPAGPGGLTIEPDKEPELCPRDLFAGSADSSSRKGVRSREQMEASEIRYRRLFEAARDGILIIDPATRRITDANPFIIQLLGYSRAELLGKELWQIGMLHDENASQAAFRELKR